MPDNAPGRIFFWLGSKSRIYILVFAAFLSGLLQALVAIGTLTVASITGYITVRDRREALAREMADRVYVPMRKHAMTWQDPEPSAVLPS